MKIFLELGDRFAAKSSWRDFALTKFCLCAMGVLLGLRIPKKQAENAEILAGGVFLAAYIPLMAKVFCVGRDMYREAIEEDEKSGRE